MPISRSRPVDRHRAIRVGFTTIELVIAMSVTLVILAVAAPLYRAQTKAVSNTAGRTDATRSANFGVDAIDQDLRNTGVGVYDGQPLFVRAAIDAISFNANMVTARTNDLVAVFYDPDADSTALGALTPSTQVMLPNSSNTYPSASYVSNAETISYYTRSDTGVSPIAGGQRVVLYRRVNRMPEEVIGRNLIQTSTMPAFRFFKWRDGRWCRFSTSRPSPGFSTGQSRNWRVFPPLPWPPRDAHPPPRHQGPDVRRA